MPGDSSSIELTVNRTTLRYKRLALDAVNAKRLGGGVSRKPCGTGNRMKQVVLERKTMGPKAGMRKGS